MPVTFPPKFVPKPLLPVSLAGPAYLAANPCQCCPDVPPDQCPVHAYNTGQHYAAEPTCAINQPSWALADPFTRGGCTCPPKLPAEVAAMVPAVVGALDTSSLLLSPIKVTRFPWIVPILAVPLAGWLLHHFHLFSL